MRTIEKFVCEICDREYATAEEAEACEAQGIREMDRGYVPQVGDIVECGIPYGWHSKPDTIWARLFADTEDHRWGDRNPKRLVSEGGCLSYALIWVVGAITVRDHKRIYHLHNPEPPQGHNTCWTSPDHYSMTLAEPNAKREKWRDENEAEWRGVEVERGALL